MAALPTEEEAKAALQGGADSWRNLVLRALAFGTEYHVVVTQQQAASSPGDLRGRLPSRAEEAANLLVTSLKGYLAQMHHEAPQDTAFSIQDQMKSDPVINATVESLWTVGCLVSSEDESKPPTEGGAGGGDQTPKQISNDCLVTIIRSLARPRPAQQSNQMDTTDDSSPPPNNLPLIPTSLLQTSLELQLLEQVGMLPKAIPLKKKNPNQPDKTPASDAVRRLRKLNTDLYYRQNKFNLLAEESEGYAKLLSYLIVGIRDGGVTAPGAVRHVTELIGAFDLDPNRVLDLSLDVLECSLRDAVRSGEARSFADVRKGGEDEWGLSHLRSSLGGRVASAPVIGTLLGLIRELDGNGSAIVHLLAFKYRHYYSISISSAAPSGGGKTETKKSDEAAKAPSRVYPGSLYLVTAFLCSHGLLDVHGLLPHFTAIYSNKLGGAEEPSALTATTLLEHYTAFCEVTVKRLKKLGSISLNSKKDDKKDDVKDESRESLGASLKFDPVLGIFRALLAVGTDWNACAAFLTHGVDGGNFTSLVKGGDADGLSSAMDLAVCAACTLSEDVAGDVCAWVSSSIIEVCGGAQPPAKSLSGARDGGKRGSSVLSSSEPLVIPSEAALADVSITLAPPLRALVQSGKMHKAQSLYLKICKLYKSKLHSLAGDSKGEPLKVDVDTLEVFGNFLVPALSLFQSNEGLAKEVWAVISQLPYTVRYKLYSEWRHPGLEKGTLRVLMPRDIKSGNTGKPLAIIESEIKTGVDARYVLKRISKENIREQGPNLARTSHNNPLVVFNDILGKIESYDNMILMMVDAFQFVSELGRDVIGYCLLTSLGGDGNKGRKKKQWLASLESFTGAFYLKFPDVELRGILAYLTNQFKQGIPTELGVLRSLIKTAGGYGFVDYDSTAALSNLQLDGRCGSRLLRRETSSFGVVDDINRKASQHLRSYLQGDDLGVIILILLSQIRGKILYKKPSETTKEHIKVIGNTYDNCEAVLCLLLEYLSDSSMDSQAKEKFASSMPPVMELHETYGVDPAVAFMLCRPLIRKALFFKDDTMLTSNEELPTHLKPFASSSDETHPYETLLPDTARSIISPHLFETFYSLAIYDILCPEERYKVDIERLNKDCERLVQFQKGGEAARSQMAALVAQATAAGGTEMQIRQATAFTKEHQAQLDRLRRNIDQLTKDFQRQQLRCKLVQSKLQEDREKLTASSGANSVTFAPAFMTFCVYPRLLLSPQDALFCAHFVKLLHKTKVPGFLTLELIDVIVDAVVAGLFCSSEDEAGNLSIFLNEIWKSVNAWRYDNDAFASELKSTVSSIPFPSKKTGTSHSPLNQPGAKLSEEFAEKHGIGDHATAEGVTHDDYKNLYTDWHIKIGTAAIGCLKSTEYMHTRAALIILSRIVRVFPTQPKTGEKILTTLEPLQNDERTKPDIRATAQGYGSQLMKSRDEGLWKEESVAVTKAREEKEKLKAEERKKKLAEQQEAMKKEQAEIEREIGYQPGRGWGRRDERGGRPRGMDQRMDLRMRGGPPLNAAAVTFQPKVGAARDLSRGPPPQPPMDGRRGIDSERWERGRQPDSRNDPRGQRRKRSRSPERGGDDSRGGPEKRLRGGEAGWEPPARRNQSSSLEQAGNSTNNNSSNRGVSRRPDSRRGAR